MMPRKRIDFIGPPGAGKTSLINAIESEHNGWKARSNFIPEILSTFYKKDDVSILVRLKSIYHLLQGNREVIGIDKLKLKRFYSDHFDTHRHVLSTAYRTLSDDEQEREFVKSVRIQLLNEVLKDQLLFEHHKHSASVGLFDDSFCNMLLLSILPQDIDVEKFKERIEPIRTSHFPNGVIYLFADCDTLFKRLIYRKQKNTSHLHLNEDELRFSLQRQIDLYEKTEDLLRSINVPILKVKMSENHDTYIEQSKKFISSL